MKHHVAFDIGNVLLKIDLDLVCEELVYLELSENKIDALNKLDNIQHGLDIGLFNFRNGIAKEYNLIDSMKKDQLKLDRLCTKWLEIIEADITSIISELRNKGARVALLSNIGIDHARLIRDRYPIIQQCIQHFSYEVGARKPSKLFFQSFLLEWPEFKNAYYFDDREENVMMAEQQNLYGFHFNLASFADSNDGKNEIRRIVDI